jgi:hypothetical protein
MIAAPLPPLLDCGAYYIELPAIPRGVDICQNCGLPIELHGSAEGFPCPGNSGFFAEAGK